MNGLIFVSYRRQDTQSATGRLCDKLQQHFGVERVFHDVESIEAGADFAELIAAKVAESSAVLAMVGPRWLEPGNSGRPRLSDADDLVRLEIETALRHRIPVIPVLVEGATIPNASALPVDVAPLFDHQAHEITESRWQYDTDRLVEQLQKLVPTDDTRGTGDLSAWREALTGYVVDFVQLLVHPRRHIIGLLAHPNLVIRAVVFFVVSQLIAAWLFVLPPVVSSVAEFVLGGVPFGALVMLLLTIPLHLAARLARVQSRAPVTFAACGYIQSVAVVLAGTGVMLLWTGLELGDTSIGPALRELLYSRLPLEQRLQQVLGVIEGAVNNPAFMGSYALANLFWLYTVGWLIVAVSALATVWRVSFPRFAFVLVLFALIVFFTAGVVGFVATR